MQRIFKYPLAQHAQNRVSMPVGARLLCVREQTDLYMNSRPVIWAIVDASPGALVIDRIFNVYGTGHEVHPKDAGNYVGTAFCGPYVWHVFERKS